MHIFYGWLGVGILSSSAAIPRNKTNEERIMKNLLKLIVACSAISMFGCATNHQAIQSEASAMSKPVKSIAVVAMAEDRKCDLADLDLDAMQSVHADITQDVYSVLTVDASVASRTSFGGTSPDNVRREIAKWRKALS